jgi:hypothetical protein
MKPTQSSRMEYMDFDIAYDCFEKIMYVSMPVIGFENIIIIHKQHSKQIKETIMNS